jgi:phage terminase large subunit
MSIVNIDFSEINTFINKKYQPYLEDYRRYHIFKGGGSAGKSYFIGGQYIIYNMIVNKCFNVLALNKVGRNNHDTTFAEITKGIKVLGLDNLFSINHSRGAEEITCKVNGNKCIFRGLDDEQKLKSITFTTGDLICIWVEEASEITEDDFNQLDIRIRGISDIPKHIILSFNPIDIDSWIKRRFFDIKLDEKDGYICESTYKDNEFLDDASIRALERLKNIDYYYYQVYVLNQWGSRSTARVFHNIEIDDFDIPEYKLQNRRFGMDFGFNHANTLMGCGFRDGELYIWWEEYNKNKLNSEFIQIVNERKLPKDYVIKSESAEPDKISEWNKAGYTVYGVSKSKDYLKLGINYLKALPKIHIHKTNCPNASREFPRFKYRQFKDGTISDSEFVELDDDTIAGIRYALEDLIETTDEGHYFIKKRL